MKMEHYLWHTDYPIWQVIQNSNGPVSVTTDANGMIKVLPLKTAKEVMAREIERKARTILLMALSEEHLAKFHKMADAKEMWEAIKSRFSLHKGYDRFQTLLSQLEIYGAGVLHEDTNQKFLSAPQLDRNDLEYINDDDLEEMDFDFHEDQEVSQEDSRRRDDRYNGNKARENSRRPTSQDDSKSLVTIDGEAVDWSGHVEEDTQNFAMMAYSSSNLGFDNEVQSCSLLQTCSESYARLKKLYDEQRDKLVISVETTTSMPVPIDNAPKVVSEPKVWTDAPIIEKYESDSDDDLVSNDDPHKALKVKGVVDSGYSRHMTGNKAHLTNYQEFKDGFVAFGGSNRRITGKGKIKAGRQHNMYSFNLKNIDPSGDLSCLFAKASIDESNKWHRRLCHVNFKNLNKLIKGNLVRGLPSKIFENDHTCVASQKRKQHKASCPKEANHNAGTEANDDQDVNLKEINLYDEHFVLPVWFAYSTPVKSLGDDIRKNEKPDVNANNTNLLSVVSTPVSVVGPSRALNDDEPSYPDDPSMSHLEDIYASLSAGIFTNSSYNDKGAVTDFNNLETTMNSLLNLAASFFSAALFDSSNQQHQLMPGNTNIFTGSSKHLVFFFKLHGSINSKASN
uniref:Ribonuclease H-like domain-containing protein n=1 Tax=Tanacetum cinerariifolium TaxID=118510 RepID=A0A6L2N4D6_TANCI|nr:ribonuclease H-like domain-containing protein [Tanacetum cinerariifolium]